MDRTPAVSRSLGALGISLHATALTLIALFLAVFVVRNVSLQWDLKTCLMAAHAALAGLDPYRIENLSELAGRTAELPFVYPPVGLFPFLALAQLSSSSAHVLWVAAKTLALVGLVLAWTRWFAPRAGVLPIALCAVFGWNAAALWDLRAGNVALIENVLLWIGFGCLIAGRRTAFAALVVAASCFKLTPALFLLLLLVPTDKPPSPARLVAALAALAALVWGAFAVGPAAHWGGFLTNIPDATTLGDANPSSLGLASVLIKAAGVADPWASRLAIAAWAAYAGALFLASRAFLRHAWAARDPLRWVMAAVFLELLVAPRPMAYGYVRLVPAPFFFSPEPFDGAAGRLFLAVILSAQGLSRLANQQSASLAVVYAPLLLTLAIWLLIARSAPHPAPRTA